MGRVWIHGHNWTDQRRPEETRLKMSLAHKGVKLSKEHKLNLSLAKLKQPKPSLYCEVWHDKEYRKDIRKDYCENKDCKGNYKQLCNHHIHLDKKRCSPNDTITLCNPCHMILHHALQQGKKPVNPKDYIIINRQVTSHIFTRKLIK